MDESNSFDIKLVITYGDLCKIILWEMLFRLCFSRWLLADADFWYSCFVSWLNCEYITYLFVAQTRKNFWVNNKFHGQIGTQNCFFFYTRHTAKKMMKHPNVQPGRSAIKVHFYKKRVIHSSFTLVREKNDIWMYSIRHLEHCIEII